MKLSLRLSAVAVLATLSAAVAPARADTTAASTINRIQILESGDSQYELFHGVLWLDYDKAQHTYRWGGKHCGEETLSEVNLSFLFAAFRSQYKLTLRYKSRLYNNASYRCITGFTVARR